VCVKFGALVVFETIRVLLPTIVLVQIRVICGTLKMSIVLLELVVLLVLLHVVYIVLPELLIILVLALSGST